MQTHSSFALSTSLQSMSKHSKTQASSAVWAHCRVAIDREDSDSKLKYCTHCTTSPVYSTNMQKHLKGQHKIDVEVSVSRIQSTTLQQLEQLYLRAQSSGQTEDIDSQVFKNHLNQNVINEALISLIVIWNLPLRMVKWPEFHTLCQVLNPRSDSFITTAYSQIG